MALVADVIAMRGIGYHTPRIAITSPIPQYVYAMTNNYVGPPVRQTRAVQCTRNDGTFKYTPCFIKNIPLAFLLYLSQTLFNDSENWIKYSSVEWL